MIPNPNEVSAFAFYTGLAGTTKSRQRRNRHKKLKESIASGDVKKSKGDEKSLSKPPVAKVKIISKGKARTQASKKIKMNKLREKVSNNKPNSLSHDELISDLSPDENNDAINGSSSPTLNQTKPKRKQPDSPPVEVVSKKMAKKLEAQERTKRKEVEKAEKVKSLKEEMKKQTKGKASSSSLHIGSRLFESLITPYTTQQFFSEYWEKKPLLIKRNGNDEIFTNYLSTSDIDTMLRYNVLMFGLNVDVTSYEDGVRQTHNPEGRAHPHIVWDYYSNGCSVRILNPQTYLNKIHTLLAGLQEYFGCFVGSNIYLTPAGTQGFAPHYDDIEAFVLQVEGTKRWRVYKPRFNSEELARYSSQNFTQDEIGEPIMDVILEPGDFLYFPRGYIHQAESTPDHHSLHITVSTYQKTSYFDLIQQALPSILARAEKGSIEYRRGLPIGYLREAGLAHSQSTSKIRTEMRNKLSKLVSQLDRYIDLDEAVDKMAVTFIHQSLPPVLTQDEALCSVQEGGIKMSSGDLSNRVELEPTTKIRWIRANAVRLVEEEGESRLYYSVDNSKEYEGLDVQYLIFDANHVPAALYLVSSYPNFVSVSSLPCSTDEDKLTVASDLWERGLLTSYSPLQPCESDSS